MAALLTLSFVAAGTLVVSGAAKWRSPHVADEALRSAGLPGGPTVVRAIGVVEIVAGVWHLAAPSQASSLALAVLYVGLAAFVVRLLTAGTASRSCGCFGRAEAPPSWLHVGVDLSAAGCALAVIGAGHHVQGVVRSIGGLGVAPGVGFAIGLAAAVYVLVAMVELLPSAFGSFRREARG